MTIRPCRDNIHAWIGIILAIISAISLIILEVKYHPVDNAFRVLDESSTSEEIYDLEITRMEDERRPTGKTVIIMHWTWANVIDESADKQVSVRFNMPGAYAGRTKPGDRIQIRELTSTDRNGNIISTRYYMGDEPIWASVTFQITDKEEESKP